MCPLHHRWCYRLHRHHPVRPLQLRLRHATSPCCRHYLLQRDDWQAQHRPSHSSPCDRPSPSRGPQTLGLQGLALMYIFFCSRGFFSNELPQRRCLLFDKLYRVAFYGVIFLAFHGLYHCTYMTGLWQTVLFFGQTVHGNVQDRARLRIWVVTFFFVDL